MLKDRWEKIRDYPYHGNTKKLMIETPAAIFIGFGTLSLVFATASFFDQSSKKGQKELGFSEIGQNRDKFRKLGKPIPPLTNYQSLLNDSLMMIFESSNEAYRWYEVDNFWKFTERFGSELEKKIEPTMRIHHQIREYAPMFPQLVKDALKSLDKIVAVNRDLPPIVEALRDSWDEDHEDHDKKVVYYERECKGEGKDEVCKDVRKTKWVYSHTIHSYDYHRKEGGKAAALLKEFVLDHPDVNIAEELSRIKGETGAENEKAMRDSRKKARGLKGVKQEEYNIFANTWADGSAFTVYMPRVQEYHQALSANAGQWASASQTAHDISYRTESHYDDGPREYRIAKAARHNAVELSDYIERIIRPIERAAAEMPEMYRDIVELVDITQHNGEGDAEALARKILRTAERSYQDNFPEGFDVMPSKWGMVFLWGLVGGLLGGGIGYGARQLIARRHSKGQDPFSLKL